MKVQFQEDQCVSVTIQKAKSRAEFPPQEPYLAEWIYGLLVTQSRYVINKLWCAVRMSASVKERFMFHISASQACALGAIY